MMIYSIEPRFRKYVKGYGFLSFAKNFGNKYVKKLMDTATKRVVEKSAEATGDLIGNKIADKITSVGKTNEKINKPEEISIPPEKRQQIIYDLKLF